MQYTFSVTFIKFSSLQGFKFTFLALAALGRPGVNFFFRTAKLLGAQLQILGAPTLKKERLRLLVTYATRWSLTLSHESDYVFNFMPISRMTEILLKVRR